MLEVLLEELQGKNGGEQNLGGFAADKSKHIFLGIGTHFWIDGDAQLVQPEPVFDQSACKVKGDFLGRVDSNDVENCSDEEVGLHPGVLEANLAKATLEQLSDQFEIDEPYAIRLGRLAPAYEQLHNKDAANSDGTVPKSIVEGMYGDCWSLRPCDEPPLRRMIQQLLGIVAGDGVHEFFEFEVGKPPCRADPYHPGSNLRRNAKHAALVFERELKVETARGEAAYIFSEQVETIFEGSNHEMDKPLPLQNICMPVRQGLRIRMWKMLQEDGCMVRRLVSTYQTAPGEIQTVTRSTVQSTLKGAIASEGSRFRRFDDVGRSLELFVASDDLDRRHELGD